MSLESFSPAEIENAMAAALDFYMKGQPLSQTIQEKPTWAKLLKGKKTFPGSRGEIKKNVKGKYTSSFQGYSGDDTVTYRNPANIKQATAPWFELHAGLSCTYTELKSNGISVNNTNGDSTSRHSDAAMSIVSDVLKDKMDDLDEGTTRSINDMAWKDGTQDSKAFPGITSIIVDDPTTGTCMGLDRSTLVDERGNYYWRNRALVGSSKITASATDQTLTRTLKSELRQLRRFGGSPSLWVSGSAALGKLEMEAYSKGYLTQTGFTDGDTSIQVPNVMIPGLGRCIYDPTLDDLSRSDYMYLIDTKHLYLMVMQNEEFKQHSPERPPEKYVLYKGLTWTGCLYADQMNCHGVYQVA
jgi:hypothetical protein